MKDLLAPQFSSTDMTQAVPLRTPVGSGVAAAPLPHSLRAGFALPAILGLLALLLRLHGLDDKPFWYDEIVTLHRESLPPWELVLDSLRGIHLPSYFLMLHALFPAGADEWALRLPSAVFGAASVLLVTLIALEIGGASAGLVSGLLMAFSPFEVQFAQEARSYTLVSALVLLALWGVVRILRRPAAAAMPPMRRGALPGAWAAYTLGTAGALEALNVAIPWLVVANLAMFLFLRSAGEVRQGLRRNWLIAQALILLLWVPGVTAIYLVRHGAVLHSLDWVPPATLHGLWSTIAAVYLFRISDMTAFALLPAPIPEFFLALPLLAVIGAWRLRGEARLLVLIGLAVAGMPIALLATAAVHALLVPRYLIWSTGPYFVLAGLAVARLPPRWLAGIAATIAVAGAANLASYYRAETKPRWDLVADYLAANLRPGDAIVANTPSARYMLAAYLERRHLSPAIVTAGQAESAAQPAADARTWLVYGRAGQGTIAPLEAFRDKFISAEVKATKIDFGGHISAIRLEPTGDLWWSRGGSNP